MIKLSEKSLLKLRECHPDIRGVVMEATELSAVPFAVGEALRTLARQRKLVDQGGSWTMNSRHLPHPKDGLSYAVDLIALDDEGRPSWAWPLYYKIAEAMKEAAARLNVNIEWGGDWRKKKDGPHYQLPWKYYP